MTLVRIDARRISDVNSFHDVFAAEFGFPAYYGRNMDAWIDCMSDVAEAAADKTKQHAASGSVVAILVDHADDLARRAPTLFRQLVDGVAFVNWRQVKAGRAAVLALAYSNVFDAE